MNTIKVKKYSDVIEEYVAAAGITPGMLLEMTSAGKVQVHSSASELAEKMFALEDELQGKGITDAYAADDPVQCWLPGRGDQVYALLADGETAAVGDFLESAGNGALKKYVRTSASEAEYPESIVGVALEAVAASGSMARIIVRII